MKTLPYIGALVCALTITGSAQASTFGQQAELTASAGAAQDVLGASLAVSRDTIVVLGASHAAEPQGVLYVYTKPDSGWADATQSAVLSPSTPGADEGLGSVSISGDTIVSGVPGHKVGNATSQGAVDVFVKPPSGWQDAHESAQLTASNGLQTDSLGLGTSISGDTVVASAPGRTVRQHSQQGAAYVFVKPTSGWKDGTQTAELTASDGAEGDELNAVAIDGDTIVAGAALRNVGANADQGAAYVFTKPADGWTDSNETVELTSTDGGAGDRFGIAVAISGGTIAIGAPFHKVGLSAPGAAYVFAKGLAGFSRSQTAELTQSDGVTEDRFGTAVAVSGDTVTVGALLHQVGGNQAQGAAYRFEKPAGPWASATETEQLIASDGAAGDVFGDTLAIAGDVVVAGAPLRDSARGAVYLFGPPPAVSIDSPADGATFTQGDVVPASYSCAAASCSGPVANGTAVDTAVLGPHTFTVDALGSDGLKGTRTASYTVVPVVHDPPPASPLRISGLKQSRRKWRAARGTTFSFGLNEPARVALRFTGRHGGTVVRAASAGANSVRFKGRISRAKRLKPGRYALQITATNAAGERSVSRRLKFTIAR